GLSRGSGDQPERTGYASAGYTGATTEIPGYAIREELYELARFEILGSSGVSGLAEDPRAG
ncbi:MAG: hypothetical protein WD810_00460, partial [Solirubrobacterales bacterium]